MKRLLLFALLLIVLSSGRAQDSRTTNFPKKSTPVKAIPAKQDVWVFILAGQSNMAGRGLVEPEDTIINTRILSIDAGGNLIYAQEPLHFYEPTMTGLDCGVAFGRTLLKTLPRSVSVLIIPAAVGGSSIEQWLGDSTYRNVRLLTNFREKVAIGRKYGIIKGVLWHQGESDANKKNIPFYADRLRTLFTLFRSTIQNSTLPILLGELGSYSAAKEDWNSINQAIRKYSAGDPYTAVIPTGDFQDKGDHIHFNSQGQRELGQRFATAYIELMKNK